MLAVSIDTLKTDWLNFIESNQLNWLNVCDLKGWTGKTVSDYFLYATPTMFLVDDQQKIISAPLTDQDLKSIF